MNIKIYNPLKSVFVLILFLCLFTAVFGQKDLEKKREIFQNQQRALSLSFYKNNIKSLEDAPMRCFVRQQIAEFIFKKKVKEHFDIAEDFVVDCLEDMTKNSKQFVWYQSLRTKANLISLLRKYSPQLGKEMAEKYLRKTDESDFSDIVDADKNIKDGKVFDRVLEKIRSGNIPYTINFLLSTTYEKETAKSLILLDAILKHYESSEISSDLDDHLDYIWGYYLSNKTPIDLKKRFINFVLRMGQKGISSAPKSKLLRNSRNMLKASLPHIKTHLPSKYQQALLLYETLISKSSEKTREYIEMRKRIEESEDKLKQIVFEAESVNDVAVEASLWLEAAGLASKEKKFQLSVDYIRKYKDIHKEFTQIFIDQFLRNEILPNALKEKDFVAAQYVVDNIDNKANKAEALLKISSKYVKLKEQDKALEKLNEALSILQKAEKNIHIVRNFLSASRYGEKINGADSFEIAGFGIKAINSLPTLNPEDVLKTEPRKKYVSLVLMPNAYNLNTTFKVLCKKDNDFAYLISQGIQRKDLRLVTEIVVEMHKKYPYTAKSETEPQN